MSSKKKTMQNKMHIIDAIDQLYRIAELDDKVSQEELITQGIKRKLRGLSELSANQREAVLESIKKTFHTVHHYLKHIYHREDRELQDFDLQQGIQSLLKLSMEAANALEEKTSLFRYQYQGGKISKLKEYEDLKQFYFDSILPRFQEVGTTEGNWEPQWEEETTAARKALVSLRDLDTVRKDQQYELFSISQEDGSSFFHRNLLRHIKLITDFDQIISDFEGDDPLLVTHVLISKQSHTLAESIKEEIRDVGEEFLSIAKQNKKNPLVAEVKKLLFPLVLAANAKNILTNTSGKSCSLYFSDFTRFLRSILSENKEVQSLAKSPITDMNACSRHILLFLEKVCFALLTSSLYPKDSIHYLQSLIDRMHQQEPKKRRSALGAKKSLEKVQMGFESIDQLLKGYPNGPLFKAIDLFRERAERVGFDPLLQGNLPYRIYQIENPSFTTTCIRLPCPTRQSKINEATIIPEFAGYLRSLQRKTEPLVHLMVDLQDPTSWQEYSRCQAIHAMASQSDFQSTLAVMTLPKRGDFYHQTDLYGQEKAFSLFFESFLHQVTGGKNSGFIFSSLIERKKVLSFAKRALPAIHLLFFSEKETLSREERLDFIEIFYLLLMGKAIEWVCPTYMSIGCKDAIDIGAAQAGAFFVFMQFLCGVKKWSVDVQDHLLFLFFAPSFLIRERMIDRVRFDRTTRALLTMCKPIEKEKKSLAELLSPLYAIRFSSTPIEGVNR